jgi:hypothetical protein
MEDKLPGAVSSGQQHYLTGIVTVSGQDVPLISNVGIFYLIEIPGQMGVAQSLGDRMAAIDNTAVIGGWLGISGNINLKTGGKYCHRSGMVGLLDD